MKASAARTFQKADSSHAGVRLYAVNLAVHRRVFRTRPPMRFGMTARGF